jgi:hypothetical protein
MTAVVVFMEVKSPIDGLLDCPAKAVRAVLVDCLEHEEHRPNLEDGGSD